MRRSLVLAFIPVLALALGSMGAFSAARAAGFDCANFEKNADGTWHALKPLQIRGPRGRIDFTPDETYKEGQEKMGLDMAKLLKMNCDKTDKSTPEKKE